VSEPLGGAMIVVLPPSNVSPVNSAPRGRQYGELPSGRLDDVTFDEWRRVDGQLG
jgi:hypothetical protein